MAQLFGTCHPSWRPGLSLRLLIWSGSNPHWLLWAFGERTPVDMADGKSLLVSLPFKQTLQTLFRKYLNLWTNGLKTGDSDNIYLGRQFSDSNF